MAQRACSGQLTPPQDALSFLQVHHQDALCRSHRSVWNEALPDKALTDDNEEADEEAAACCTYVGNAVYVLHCPLDPGALCVFLAWDV